MTSYNELRREALRVERWNRLHPAEAAKKPYIQQVLERHRRADYRGVRLHEDRAGSDCAVAAGRISRWAPMASAAATTATYLREHFEVNAASIAAAALSRLARDGKFDAKKAAKALTELGVDPEKADPAYA